ncbi:hypothetical protein OPV22_003367 [Ensete ventricosum]|uniref:YTH domain-containing family protein n=1 Tax=Ensete ventricosum TaxID=4639 RepID=A0AAV8S0M7_ENSVE|nr:hypothetical protein OPV22_003367 [Ensete ventricosum]
MATVATAPSADQATDLIQKLSLDTTNKSSDSSEVKKKPSGVQYGSANGGEAPIAPIPTYERSLTPLLQEHMDAGMCYVPNGYTPSFYYGGYDGSMAEWEDYPRYVNSDGVEVPPPGVYGDMYHHGYGYAPYGPYPSPGSPVPTLGHNGQLYGPQHYQFPATYYQPPTATSAPDTTSQIPSSKREVSTSTAASLPSIPVDTTKSDSNETVKASTNGNNGSLKLKPSQQNSSLNSNGSLGKGAFPGGHPSSGYQDPRFGFDGMWSPVPWYDSLMFPDGQQRPTTANTVSSTRNQNLRPLPHLMGMHAPRTAGAGMESKEKTSGCPVFLFFSVNTSGQFVGVAEMWHIVKDVPNNILKHITLENNDNKPVTNSRDTQEVKLDQGLQLLKLFKEHASKTCILDDFDFYETRQKVMQEKRTKQQQLQKKFMDGKPVEFGEKDKDASNGKPGSQKPLEVVTVLKKESAQVGLALGEHVLSEKNGLAAVAGVAPKDAKPVTEKWVVANGVANCC